MGRFRKPFSRVVSVASQSRDHQELSRTAVPSSPLWTARLVLASCPAPPLSSIGLTRTSCRPDAVNLREQNRIGAGQMTALLLQVRGLTKRYSARRDDATGWVGIPAASVRRVAR